MSNIPTRHLGGWKSAGKGGWIMMPPAADEINEGCRATTLHNVDGMAVSGARGWRRPDGLPPNSPTHSFFCAWQDGMNGVAWSRQDVIFRWGGERKDSGLDWQVAVSSWKMGGAPVTVEPPVLTVDEEVSAILASAGLLNFLMLFNGHNEDDSRQAAETWKDGCFRVNGREYTVNLELLSEISGLPMGGDLIQRDRTNQSLQVARFLEEKETFCWLDSGIARTSLPPPWDRVATCVMKYFTLEGKFRKLYGFHIQFLNFLRHHHPVNIPDFLMRDLNRSMAQVQTGKAKLPLHQGLIQVIMQYVRQSVIKKDIRALDWVNPRRSGTPISRSDLLGSGPAAPSGSRGSPATPGKASSCRKRQLPKEEKGASRRSARLMAKDKKMVIVSSEEPSEDQGMDNKKGEKNQQETHPPHVNVKIYLGKDLDILKIANDLEELRTLCSKAAPAVTELIDSIKKAKVRMQLAGSADERDSSSSPTEPSDSE